MIWGSVIGAVAYLPHNHTRETEKAVAKQKLEVAKIEAQTTKASIGEWENEAIKARDNSWKDEFALGVLLDRDSGLPHIPAKYRQVSMCEDETT